MQVRVRARWVEAWIRRFIRRADTSKINLVAAGRCSFRNGWQEFASAAFSLADLDAIRIQTQIGISLRMPLHGESGE